MITKSEFFEFNPTATEEDWKEFQKLQEEMLEEEWNNTHPLDD